MTRLLIFNLATDADDSALGFAVTWIAEFAKHVEAIDVITMRAGRFELPPHVHVYSVGKEKGYSEPRRVVEFYRTLFRLLRHNHYDGCFAHMMPLFALMAGPVLRLKRIPCVLWYAHKSVTPILRLAAVFSRRVVTSSMDGCRIASAKVRVIGQGIDADRFLLKDEAVRHSHAFTIVTIGRISEIKRIELLVKAAAFLRQYSPEMPFQLIIVGKPLTEKDRLYIASLNQRIIDEHLDDVTIMPGSIPFEEILCYYQEADCCVNLSPTGAPDKVVLEAMSCGVIPLVTNRSFQKIFGEELATFCMTDDEPAQIASRFLAIQALSNETRRAIGIRLRDIVVRDHSLAALCRTILNEIAGESA